MPADSDVTLQPLTATGNARWSFDGANSEISDEESAVFIDSPQSGQGLHPEDPEDDLVENRPTRLKSNKSASRSSPTLLRWMQGPDPPRIFAISPVFKDYQTWPARILEKSRYKVVLLFGIYMLWLASFGLILYRAVTGCSVEPYGQPVRLSCSSRFWKDGPSCGPDGVECQPFDNITFAFRCPANCEVAKVWNPYVIGTEEIVYRSLVVGGLTGSEERPDYIYRGDSFICGAALQAGLISDSYGGTGVVSLVGEQNNFSSISANGVSSIGFLPRFPLSFTFLPKAHNMPEACKDPRWSLLMISVIATSIISIFTQSPAVFYWSSFIIPYFTVALGADPPDFDDFNDVISTAFAGFLPAAFVAAIIYIYCARRTLQGLTAQFEKTILWLGACWAGALNAYTFDNIPLQRLTPHDLREQPGAIPTLLTIIFVLIAVTLGQAWAFRIEGRMPRYLNFYGILISCILTLVLIPNLNLRIHHYILALLLVPGTALQTRPSLLYQGLLVGLFISGIARWGFASILETDAVLFSDGPVGGSIPSIAAPTIFDNTVLFDWSNLTDTQSGSRISILVNDVERFRSPLDYNSPTSFNWTRYHDDEEEYFRMAYVRTSRMGRDSVGDYSKASTWFGNGSWIASGD